MSHPKEPPGITIDDKSTRDIDDAIAIERLATGWRAIVSIADVSRLVARGSEFDLKARERVATRYYGSGNSPMLPRFLAENQLSLWPEKRRPVLTVDFTMADDLTTTKVEVYEAILRSQAKLTYDEIPGIIANKDHPLHTFGVQAKALALGLLTQRRASGALVMYDLNNGWVTTEEGDVKKFENKDAVIGYIIIQEMMIRTNAEIARLGVERGISLLFRNHNTRDAGPEREVLVRAIQEAASTPLVGLDELRKKTHQFLERAVYGSKLTGHFGLNLPAYLHFTSPIRRYADLVNHHQVKAMIQGKTSPYTTEQIEEIAQHINSKAEHDRQSTSDHFKDKAEVKAQRAIDARRLDGLSAKEFERAVKVEARGGENDASDALYEAFGRKLQEGTLPLICMTLVLGEDPEGPRWAGLKADIIERLTKYPENAVSILTQGIQIVGWAAAEYITEAAGPDHQRVFYVTARIGEHEFKAGGKTSKEAKQKASVGLLALLAYVTPPAFDEPVLEAPAPVQAPPPDSDAGNNSVGRLQEFSQQHKKPPPIYTFKQEGPSHMPVIACMCVFEGISKTAVASSKKDAKKLAAEAVLVQVVVKYFGHVKGQLIT